MAIRPPLVLGADGLLQQLQATDSLATGGTTPTASSTSVPLGNGNILKAGSLAVTNGVGTFTFPVPFPTGCIAVNGNVYSSGATATSSFSVTVKSYTATGFTVDVSALGGTTLILSAVTGQILWQAIGY